MLQKGQIGKAREMNPVFYIQPFSTCCLASNRRQSDHGLWRQIQQKKMGHKPTQSPNWILAVQESWHAITWLRNSAQNFWALYSTFHTGPCSHSHHNQPMSRQSVNKKQPFLLPWLFHSLQNTSLSPAKLSLCQNRGCLPFNRYLVLNTDQLYQNLQILQFSTYLSRVSWGTLLPPALLLTLLFLLAVMVISAF